MSRNIPEFEHSSDDECTHEKNADHNKFTRFLQRPLNKICDSKFRKSSCHFKELYYEKINIPKKYHFDSRSVNYKNEDCLTEIESRNLIPKSWFVSNMMQKNILKKKVYDSQKSDNEFIINSLEVINKPVKRSLSRNQIYKKRPEKIHSNHKNKRYSCGYDVQKIDRNNYLFINRPLRRTFDKKDLILLNYNEKERRKPYLKNEMKHQSTIMVEKSRNSSIFTNLNDNNSTLNSIKQKGKADKSEDTESTGKKRSPNKTKVTKKTLLDYLIEEAHRELQKMKEIEILERKRHKMEREKRFTELKDQENKLNEEIEKIDDIHFIPDDIFEIRIENNIKMYYCPKRNCNKGFPSLSRVRRHYIVHTGHKPYKCLNPDCKKKFSRKDNMLQHFRNHCFSSKKRKFKEFEP